MVPMQNELLGHIERLCSGDLRPHGRNNYRHSGEQIPKIADSIQRFVFTKPVLLSDELAIIAGHGRAAAAMLLGIDEAPLLRPSHLSGTERRAHASAGDKRAPNPGRAAPARIGPRAGQPRQVQRANSSWRKPFARRP